jgi:hypothetical protein
MRRAARVVGLAVSILASLPAGRALACEYSEDVLNVGATGMGAPPGPIGEVTYTVQRGKGPVSSGCGQSSASSCDDIGSITLDFAMSEDADNDASEVGYRVRIVEGNPPIDFMAPAGPLVARANGDGRQGTLSLHWADGATDDQETIAFAVTLTPIDADGNEGPESDLISIRSEAAGGCVLARHPRTRSELSIGAGLLLGLAWVLRRSRARS